jgi:hypothetical protein
MANDIIQNSDAEEEQNWLRAATASPAFEFLKDQEENIYTLSDGKPFIDEGHDTPGVQN